MSLETIYYISQIIAVLAVLASLIFVGIQIQQNTEQAKDANRLARAQMHQQIADGFTEAMSLTLQIDDEIVESVFMNGITDQAGVAEMQKFSALMLGLLKHLENVFYQHKEGFVANEYWQSTCNYLILLLGRHGARQWWDKRKSVFANEFTQFVDELEQSSHFEELNPAHNNAATQSENKAV